MKKQKIIIFLTVIMTIMMVGITKVNAKEYYGLMYKPPENKYKFTRLLDSTSYWTLKNEETNEYSTENWIDNQYALDINENNQVIVLPNESAALVTLNSVNDGYTYASAINKTFGVCDRDFLTEGHYPKYLAEIFEQFQSFQIEYNLNEIQQYYDKYNSLPSSMIVCFTANGNQNGKMNFYVTSNHLDRSYDILVNLFYMRFKKIYIDMLSPVSYDAIIPKLSNVYENINYCNYVAVSGTKLNCAAIEDKKIALKYSMNKNGCDSEEFKNQYNDLLNFCDTYRKQNNFTECSNLCDNLETEYANNCHMDMSDFRCGSLGSELVGWLMKILKIIRYIVPVLVIILSAIDYIQAVGASNDDALKKASGKFVKRIIAAVIIFLLPVILQFLFDVFKIKGLNSDNPFCMK